MTTGPINYKSERRAMRVQTSDSGRRFVDTRELIEGELTRVQREDAEQAAWAERTRLEREVIEAAKAEREAQKEYLMRLNFITSEIHHAAMMRRTEAVDALIDFEASRISNA